ncbi:MAG: hypothetical protein ACN4GW_10880 [Desulforhopalus sp.]
MKTVCFLDRAGGEESLPANIWLHLWKLEEALLPQVVTVLTAGLLLAGRNSTVSRRRFSGT